MTRTRAALLPALGLALLLPLSACGSDTGGEPETTPASGDASASSSPTPEVEASPSATSEATPDAESTSDPEPSPSVDAEPSPTADPTVAPAPGAPTATGGRFGRLLTAAELPGFDADWAWMEVGTSTSQERPFTLCERFGFSDIGATGVVVRRFDAAVPGADGDTAAELVATFPDAKQARQAQDVLRAWAEDCTTDRAAGAEVSAWTPVQVADGAGAWYAVTVDGNDPERALTERVTVVQRTNRVAVVRSQLLGRPRDYPATQDPAALTARPAASKLTR